MIPDNLYLKIIALHVTFWLCVLSSVAFGAQYQIGDVVTIPMTAEVVSIVTVTNCDQPIEGVVCDDVPMQEYDQREVLRGMLNKGEEQ